MSITDLEEQIAALLERRGLKVTDVVRRAIDTLVAEAEDSVDRRGRALDEDDATEADSEDGDLSPTRMIGCPHCGERLPIALDLSGGDQDGIQDCEVCCRPIRIAYSVEAGHVTEFRADPA